MGGRTQTERKTTYSKQSKKGEDEQWFCTAYIVNKYKGYILTDN
jgi:hypothetical protein